MSELFTHPVRGPGFVAEASQDDDGIRISVGGTADLSSRDALEQTLVALDREMLRLGLTRVVVDLRELTFMNSSSLKSVISWISHMQERPLKQRYFIRFISNPEHRWQQRSLDAVRCFAETLITID